MSFRNPPHPLLVEDILMEVFESLTLRDRKNARLVCKTWLDVSNRQKFTKTEAFYISLLVKDYQAVADVLNNCRKATLSVKFCSSLFDNESLPLWRTCGKKIESLTFNKCTFHVRIIPIIFEICVNLVEFHLRFAKFVNNNPRCRFAMGRDSYFLQDSALLPRKKLVRQKLTTFCAKFDHCTLAQLRRKQVTRFAATFPALKVLKLTTYFADRYNTTVPFYDMWLPTFSTWVRSLATELAAVENLDLQYIPRFDYNPLKPKDLSVFRLYDLNNLKKVSLPIDCLPRITVVDLNTIYAFKFWTCFTIDCESNKETTDIAVVAKLIEENPQLEKLCVRFGPKNMEHMGPFFTTVITSRLRSVVFEVPIQLYPVQWFTWEVDVFLQPGPVNNSVRRLEINHYYAIASPEDDDYYGEDFDDSDCERITAEFCSFCVKYFRNVRYLKTQRGDTEDIFKYQANLEQLEMRFVELPQPSPKIAIVVESLEVLDIRSVVLDILSAYQFPNLKCLIIKDCFTKEFYRRDGGSSEGERQSRSTAIFIKTYNRVSRLMKASAPNVEFLHVVGHPLLLLEGYTVFFESCVSFPKLRYVSMSIDSESIAPSKENVKAEMLRCMRQCPQLRIVRLQTWEWTISLAADIIDKTFKFSETVSESQEEDDANRELYKGADLKRFFFYKRY